MSIFRKAPTAEVRPASETVEAAATTPADDTVTNAASAPDTSAPAAPSPASPKTFRSGSKGPALLALLQRQEGASLNEMIERTGWQGHTVRAAMTGLRKKGHLIDKRTSGNMTVWFITAEPAA